MYGGCPSATLDCVSVPVRADHIMAPTAVGRPPDVGPTANTAMYSDVLSVFVSAYTNSATYFQYVHKRHSTSSVRTTAVFLTKFPDNQI